MIAFSVEFFQKTWFKHQESLGTLIQGAEFLSSQHWWHTSNGDGSTRVYMWVRCQNGMRHRKPTAIFWCYGKAKTVLLSSIQLLAGECFLLVVTVLALFLRQPLFVAFVTHFLLSSFPYSFFSPASELSFLLTLLSTSQDFSLPFCSLLQILLLAASLLPLNSICFQQPLFESLLIFFYYRTCPHLTILRYCWHCDSTQVWMNCSAVRSS